MKDEQIRDYILSRSEAAGIIFFGSRARNSNSGDFDIGIIHDDAREPDLEIPADWDLFLWSRSRWQEGFALQVELAREAKILYDPDSIIAERFKMIHEHILPHWAGYLKRIS